MTLLFAFPVALAPLLVERFLYQCIGDSRVTATTPVEIPVII
jgi:hypothetical protein